MAGRVMKGLNLPNLKCLRCGHRWVPRSNNPPRVCPLCKSPYWNVPRRKRLPRHR